MQLKKILIIRFSSIGDIVLTTPVIRCLNQQLPDTIIHFVTKSAFSSLLSNNPFLHKIYTFENDISELYEELKVEKYDLVIDLHKNLRSFRLKQKLKTRSSSFDKLNFRKFLAVNFKMRNKLPAMHIVDRYFETVAPIQVFNDGKGLDYFLSPADFVAVEKLFPEGNSKYMALVIGGSYYTKQIPLRKLREICSYSKLPLVLLGGAEDVDLALRLVEEFPTLINACGKYNIGQSASIIQQAEWVITSDTGMMHIAAAFNKKIISLWGNTIPEFGMVPYLPNPDNKILEIKTWNAGLVLSWVTIVALWAILNV